MSTQVQFRRGTTTQNNAFTGAQGELSVDTDLKTIRLHDGTTAGGGSTMLNNISAQTALNKTFSTGSVWQGNAVGLGYGGTGSALSPAAGAVLYSTASGLALSAAGTSGQILVSGGAGAPTFVAASSIAAGTSTTAATATNIAGGSAGQLIIQADTSLSTFITAGASGTFLRSAGAGYAPTWATADVTIGSTVIALGSSSTSLAGMNIIAATGTSHWTLPVGTTGNRPVSPAAGMVRYNSTITSFEGYSSGAWSSLGGVSSVDKFTYIQAETSANASNGDLDFFAEDAAGTAATQVGQWNRTNLKDYTGTLVGTQTTQNVFNATATTVNAFGAATTLSLGAASGTATVNNSTVTLANATALNINGASPAIATTSTTASLFNSTVTTLNIGGAATTISIGAATGTLTINNANTVITGNLTVNGTTTTINSTVTSVDDIEFELGSVASPTNVTANGGGIRLKGTTDKTITWDSTNANWTSSENWNLATGKTFKINNVSVLTANAVLNDSTQTSITVGGSATAITLGANSGTLTIGNPTVVGTQTTQNLFNTVATTLNIGGASTALNLGASTGTATIANQTVTLSNATALNLNGASPVIATTSTTASVFNSSVTTLHIGSAATTLAIGNATSATLTLRPGTVVGSNTTQNLYNTVATTLNLGGAATALNLGASTGTTTVNNDLTVASGKKIVMTNIYDIVAFSGSTSGTGATAITTLSSSVYRSGKVVLSITNGSVYRIMEMLFMHDGTTVTFNENYTVANEMQSATTNTTFSGSISAGTLTIFATCSSGTSAIKGQATLFKV
jgi:hypothetical protein